ncbi:MAG: TetR family transcriptional regulator [Bacillota bacterium]
MPTYTFLNLSEEKRNKIINAAIEEFSNNIIDKASINKIVKNANISRGSFYTYFKDKYDLLDYLIILIKSPLEMKIKDRFLKSKREFIEMMLIVHDEVYDLLDNDKYKNFIKHVSLFFHNNIVKNPNNRFFESQKDNNLVMEYIDKNQFKSSSDIYLKRLLRIAQALLTDVFIESMIKNNSKEKSRENYLNLLKILKTGYERS